MFLIISIGLLLASLDKETIFEIESVDSEDNH